MEKSFNLIDKALTGTGDSDQHLLFLYSIVVCSKAKNILELGVRWGDSTIPLVLGAKLTGGMVTSIDKEPTTLVLSEELQKYNKFIQINSIDYLINLDPSTLFDIVLIDDWHEYGHVKKEIELLEKHITPSSVILLHDLMYNTAPNYHSEPWINSWEEFGLGGPYRAVSELNPVFWEWATLPWNNGMTILRKKVYKPPVLP